MSKTPDSLISAIDFLTLGKGLYLFSVRTASPKRTEQYPTLLLPAIQIAPAPGVTNDQFTIMSGPRTQGSWLCEEGDVLVAKISADVATVVLTSVRLAEMTPTQIDVRRLDILNADSVTDKPARRGGKKQPSVRESSQVLQLSGDQTVPNGLSAQGGVSLQVVAHIQNRGDVPFVGAPWAGFSGKRLAIEGFALSPLDHISADRIEYKALSTTKTETPWVAGGEFCGTRGKGLPLIGFCVRVKPLEGGKRFECEYSGLFASGKTVGPVKNGAPCWSADPGDFIEAIQIKIIEREIPNTPAPS